MTRNQMVWARLHDWYRCDAYVNGVCVGVVVADQEGLHIFEDYQELRAWAGY